MDNDAISRSAALEILGKRCGGANFYPPEIYPIASEIEELPALDVAPVNHGIWKNDRTNIVCSVCGTAYSDEIVFMKRGGRCKNPKYCPNCGAIMDAKEG